MLQAKLLKNPIRVKVTPIKYWNSSFPDCINPNYIPIREPEFEATAHAIWEIAGEIYYAVENNGIRLVVPAGFISSPYAVKEILENLEDEYISSVKDVERYGLKAFCEDALLMDNNHDVEILETKTYGRGVEVRANYKWTLHGHIKPVYNIKQIICFDIHNKTEILLL